MKILHVIASTNPEGGGPVEGLKQIGTASVANGQTVEVVSLDAPDSLWLNDFPLKNYALGPSKGGYAYAPKLIPWLEENVKNYDAVIVNGIWQYHGFAVHKVLTKLKRPYFVYTHGMLDPWFKTEYPLKHLKKLAYWGWGEHPVLRDAAAVLFTCEEEKILARQSFKNYHVNERVVAYGSPGPQKPADQLKTAFQISYPELDRKRFLLFLGRIHPKKGCDMLVEAFAKAANKYPDLDLLIAGPDHTGWKPKLIEMAREKGVETRIHWLGMIQGDVKWGAFCAADAFILPSHQENFGIAVAEALSCGTPVLISNKVNIRREIEGAGAGIVESDSIAGTEALIERWQRLSISEKETMRAAAEACFLKHFEIAAAAKSLFTILEEYVKNQQEKPKSPISSGF